MPSAAVHPREWVARFIGDKGPIQIGSQAAPESMWAHEPEAMDPLPAESGEPGEPPPPLSPAETGPGTRWRIRLPGDPRLITTASLAAVAVIVLAVVGLHALGSARHHAAGSISVVANTDSIVPASPTARTPAASAPIPRGPYTLEVGGSPDVQAALDQRQRLQSLTGIQGWVVSPTEAGDGKYRIVLGVFHSYARATAAAHAMMRSRTLASVKVITMPPRTARQ